LKLSIYNIQIPIPTSENFLVINTLTNSVIQMDRPFHERLNSILTSPSDEIDGEMREAIKALKDNGILVADELDECQLAREQFDRARYSTDRLSIALMLTYDCNFRCRYCYQAGHVAPDTMNPETEAKILRWVKDKIAETRPQILALDFYGGEPLLEKERLRRIAFDLSAYAMERGVTPELGIITNGYDLNRVFIADLCHAGLKWVKVTIDGNQPSHDFYRPQADGSGSYERIVENVAQIADLVEVRLSGNFDKDNLGSFKEHLENLNRLGLHERIKALHVRPIIQVLKADGAEGLDCRTMCSYRSVPSREYLELRDFAAALGFPVVDTLAFGPCEAVIKNAFNIDPYGDIYKCPAFVGDKSQVVGNVAGEGLNGIGEQYLWLYPFENCGGCAYLPLCYGSCRFVAYQHTGSLAARFCEKKYFEDVVKPIYLRTFVEQ